MDRSSKWKSGRLVFIVGLGLVLSMFIEPSSLRAQSFSTFRIENPGDYDLGLLSTVFSRPAWDSFRKMDSENAVRFVNGAAIFLYPAQKLIADGIPVDVSHLVPENKPEDVNQKFELLPTGELLERRSISSTVKRP